MTVVRGFGSCVGVAGDLADGNDVGEAVGEDSGVPGVTAGMVDSWEASAAVMVIDARPWHVSSQQRLMVCSPGVASCGIVTGVWVLP